MATAAGRARRPWTPDLVFGAAISAGWFLIDKVLFDLLPKPSQGLGWRVAGLGLTLVVAASAALAWRRARLAIPGPWICRPFWRSARWVAARPTLGLVMAIPRVRQEPAGGIAIEGYTVTLNRAATRAPGPVTFVFDKATLTVVQTQRGRTARWTYRVETPDERLAEPLSPGASDAVQIAFAPIDALSGTAPHPARRLDLRLTGVTARVGRPLPMRGTLPPIERIEEPSRQSVPVVWSGASL